MTRRLRVGLLFGGRSEEHEVSNVSAASVLEALDRERFDPVPIGIDRAGRWLLLDGPPRQEPGAQRLPAIDPAAGEPLRLALERGAGFLERVDGSPEHIDVVFPVLHGPWGEDGTIQGFLETADVPYVGAGVLASAIGMDKGVQKALFREAGLPVVEHAVVTKRDGVELMHERAERLGYPVFVKPSSLGSSVGISKVKAPGDLEAALDEALAHGGKALIERAVEDAREIECAVLGNDEPVASLPGEIIPGAEFYDYRAKYLDSSTRLQIPAELPEEVVREIRVLAIEAFGVIGSAGMARVDFFLRGGREVIVNEINTIPGFTKVSMYPLLWEASGLPYRELVTRLIELALERHAAP